MKKREVVNLIELNKKVLNGSKYKKIVIPEFDELDDELGILKKEVQEGIKVSEEAKEIIKKCNCDHSVRFSYPGGWGYMSNDEYVFCKKGFNADNVIHTNTIYDDVNRNRYCVSFTTNYFYDPDFYCDYGYDKMDVYDLLLSVIKDIDNEEDIDFVQLFKKLNIKNCKIDERRKEKTQYILIISGTNKYFISENQYIMSDSIPLITDFTSFLTSIPGVRIELFDNYAAFKDKKFTNKFDVNKNRNIRCVSYSTTEEIEREVQSEKNVPFDIIIDMSSLYDYKVDNGKIVSEKIDINFKEIFPDSYIIKIDDFSSRKKIEVLSFLKERLLNYNEAYGYKISKGPYFGVIDDEDEFYKVNGNNVGTTDINEVYKNIRRVLVKR